MPQHLDQHRASTPATRCSCSPSPSAPPGLSLPAAVAAAIAFARAADADRIGGLGHRPRRFDAGVLLPGGVPAVLPVAHRAAGRAVSRGRVAACFVALFSKQNTITLAPALVAYDIVLGRRPVRCPMGVAAAVRTFRAADRGYLLLRYAVFGQVARESMLINGAAATVFAQDVSTPSPTNGLWRIRPRGVAVARAAIWSACVRLRSQQSGCCSLVRLLARGSSAPRSTSRSSGWFLGSRRRSSPGYASPRHMYLASAGWAITLGIAFDVLWQAQPGARDEVDRGGCGCRCGADRHTAARLVDDVRLWETRAMVSHRARRRHRARSARRSARHADHCRRAASKLGFRSAARAAAAVHARRSDSTGHGRSPTRPSTAVRRFCGRRTREGLCASGSTGPDRPPVIALYWNPDTGQLSRVSDRDDPYLRPLMKVLLETREPCRARRGDSRHAPGARRAAGRPAVSARAARPCRGKHVGLAYNRRA